MSSMNLFQKGIAKIKVSRMVSSCRPMKRLAHGGAALVLHACANKLGKMPVHEQKIVDF